MRRFIVLILLSLLFLEISGQNFISGTVTDEASKEKLAFVNIVVNENGTLGTTSDIDGNFTIKSKEGIKSLTFSFVGYEKKKVDIIEDENNISVRLKPQNIELSEIVIDGTKNPANRIIDSVFKYRDSNNPKSLDSYHYKMYDNMIFTVDTSNLSPNDELRQEFRNNDLMVMETVSEQYYQKPNKNKKIILAKKVSGLNNSNGVYLIENIQSIGFQEDLVTINNKKYVNPISKGSHNKYIFYLESAYKTEENDSIFTIAFAPYKNTTFNSLRGTMTINSDNWAIQNIKAEPNKQDIFSIDIQQLYEKVDGAWFPKQLNTNMKIVLEGAVDANTDGILCGIGKSYVSEIEINKEIDKNIFDMSDYSVSENVENHDDVIKYYRYEKLDEERLEATYKYIENAFKEINFNFDNVFEYINSLMDNEIPIGFINLNFDNIIDYNIGNGFMLGLGLNTNEKVSKIVSLGGYGNYWFKAKEFNYGGNLDINLLGSKDMKLKFSAEHKFERLGDYGFESKTNIFDPSDYKLFYVNATSLNNSISANYSTYFNKYIKGFVNFEVADKTPFNWEETTTYRLSTLDFVLRIAFNEKFARDGNKLRTEGIPNPVIWVSYQKNLKDIFGSPYNFDKAELQFKGSKDTRYVGTTTMTAQLGYISGVAPITDLFNIFGSNKGKFELYSTDNFNTMRPEEFFCDRFAALFFSHNFRNLLIDFKNFHPELILVTNIAWGKLSNENNYDLKDLSKGYYESGIVIDSIIKTMFNKLGLGIFYRYGPYSFDKVSDNFTLKLSAGFNF
ncbi:MAG: carboxypeptidase-like regulatory domain-containing protein [Bacteroidales bacterium]|nr:carboxypeptidase-like regulatory domain-containing protein [Bacteroidales bacterium]